jgi:hypothetical protein
MLHQSPSSVSLMQDGKIGSRFVRFSPGIFGHKFLAPFYEFQRTQRCNHGKWVVAGDALFGVWYTGPNKSKTFPFFLSLPHSPSPPWPLARSASSKSARPPFENDHSCLLRLQNKRLSKGKKGIKKKVVDPFSRKGPRLSLHFSLEYPG